MGRRREERNSMTFEQHCLESQKMFGGMFEEVHHWLDEYAGSAEYGYRHRKKRHHEAGIKQAIALFGITAGDVARQHIIGWYRNATVYASTRPKFPASVTKEMLLRLKQSGMRGFRLIGYRFEAAVESATLLPTYERRKQKIPGNVKGGFGRSNIRYLFPTGGKTQISKWMEDAIQYVLTYDRANLLDDPSSEINLEEEASLAAERAAGFQSDPKIRKTIEQHAMKKAQKALEERGFSKFENTSATKPYDFTCWREEKPFFVEVKGTQTPGKTVILTKNEVEHVKSNPDNCVLVVVYSVKLTGKKTATAGMTDVTEKWDLTDGELTATQYLWRR